MELGGKVAMVTGAGSGIGQAIAVCFAKEGAISIVADIDKKNADNTVGKIESTGGQSLAVVGDISKIEDVRAIVAKGTERFQTIDILVNCAGIAGSSIMVKDLPSELWDRVLAVNLKGAFNCCQAVLPLMMEKRGGKIVNIASLAASRMAGLDGANYTASKYGLLGFSKHLAFEVAVHGINVNVVNPGATLTPLMASKTTTEFRAKLAEMIPLGRMISPDDIAEAVLFLVSDRAAMITGVALDVSGGQLLGIASDYKDNLQQRIAASEQSLKRFLEKKQPRY